MALASPAQATRRRLAFAGTVIAGSAAAWWAWPDAVPVETAVVSRPPVDVTVVEPARARFRDRYVVSAPLEGRAVGLVRPPASVQAGQVVARLLPSASALGRADRSNDGGAALARAEREYRDAVQAVAVAEAERSRVRADAQRAEVLYAQRLLDRERVEEGHARVMSADAALRAALARHEASRAQVDAARAVLALHDLAGPSRELALRAPAGGRLVRVLAAEGADVEAGQALLEIADSGAIEILADIRTVHALHLGVGAPVHLGSWGDGAGVDGRVRRVEPDGFSVVDARGQREQRVTVVADVEPLAAARARLGEGSRTLARFSIHAGRDAVGVPASALIRDGGRWAVFVVSAGRARLRHIEPGPVGQRTAAVYAGVSAGERVVLAPPAELRDGTRVRDPR